MKKNVIGYCPVCNKKLTVKTLRCNDCDTEISGDFNLTPFDYLTPSQLEFALVFIKCQGNIKAIEKQMGISYPTVKKNIDDLISGLGFKSVITDEALLKREDVKAKLKSGEITFEEAERILGGL